MKISIMLAAAGLAVASMGVSASASAQSWGNGRDGYRSGHNDRDRYRDRDRRHYDNGRHYDRGRHDDRGGRYDRRSYGWNRHCRTIWRYGHRVRVCR